MTELDWRQRARCRNEDPELFFPVGTTGPVDQQIEDAKAVCWVCPVREVCLKYALDRGTDTAYGIWGGLTEEERRSLRRGGPTHGTDTRYKTGCRCAACSAAHRQVCRQYRESKRRYRDKRRSA